MAVPEGTESLETLSQNGRTRHYLWEAFRHLKPIALPGEASVMLLASGLRSATTDLTANEDATQEQIRALKKRVEELEAKVKYQ